MTTDYEQFFIGGGWVPPSSSERITVTGASTEEVVGGVPEGKPADMDAAVGAARAAFDDSSGWSRWEPGARAEVMDRLADALEARGGEIAGRVSMQSGMTLALSSQLEGQMPAVLLRYYAKLLRSTPMEEAREGMFGAPIVVRREPVGVVGAIVPWNAPQVLAALKYAPALAAGCTLVLKPSPEAPLDLNLLADAAAEASVPDGVINIVPGGREVGAYLVSHPGIDKVAFTGSSAAGRKVAAACGELLRPVTLELGGKSAAIVLEDSELDLEKMGADLFAATMLANGQACFASTRVLAPRSRYDEVVEAVAAMAGSLSVGDPLDMSTQIGPLVSERQRDRVEGYIAKGIEEGSRLVVGGGRPDHLGRGWFVEPTVFADVDNRQVIAQEEIFGPVLTVTRYEDENDAVRIANESDFGLGGSVWTADPEHGLDIARRVHTGTIGINNYNCDLAVPFGGVKASGVGREGGPEGLHSYQQLKSIYQ